MKTRVRFEFVGREESKTTLEFSSVFRVRRVKGVSFAPPGGAPEALEKPSVALDLSWPKKLKHAFEFSNQGLPPHTSSMGFGWRGAVRLPTMNEFRGRANAPIRQEQGSPPRNEAAPHWHSM